MPPRPKPVRRRQAVRTRPGAEPKPTLCARAVVAVTGSIGALWAAQFILELRAGGYVGSVRVAMTRHAAQLVTPVAMRAVSGAAVLTDLFDPDAPFAIGHVEIALDADVFIVMPATANIIAKAAHGIADDVVSASILAASCPVVFVPNMNERMWRHPTVRRNVRQLVDVGYHVVPPASGIAASTLRVETGGMPDFDQIRLAVRRAIRPRR